MGIIVLAAYKQHSVAYCQGCFNIIFMRTRRQTKRNSPRVFQADKVIEINLEDVRRNIVMIKVGHNQRLRFPLFGVCISHLDIIHRVFSRRNTSVIALPEEQEEG
jgi:hypothetical protein